MSVVCVIPFALFEVFFGSMSQLGSPERPPPDADALESSPGTNQEDKPKKGRKKKGDKKPIPEMKLTVDVPQW